MITKDNLLLDKTVFIEFYIDGSKDKKLVNLNIEKIYKDFFNYMFNFDNSVFKITLRDGNRFRLKVNSDIFNSNFLVKSLKTPFIKDNLSYLYLSGYIDYNNNILYLNDKNISDTTNCSVCDDKSKLSYMLIIKY